MFDILISDGVFDPNTAITGKINNNLIQKKTITAQYKSV